MLVNDRNNYYNGSLPDESGMCLHMSVLVGRSKFSYIYRKPLYKNYLKFLLLLLLLFLLLLLLSLPLLLLVIILLLSSSVACPTSERKNVTQEMSQYELIA